MGAENILVAQNANVYLAPVGTAAPVDESVALAATWRLVGLFTPESLQLNDAPAFESTTSHQSNYPTRTWQTGAESSVAVDLQEFSGENFKAVYGGGAITEPTPGHYKFVPPAVGGRGSVAAIIEVVDGTKRYRWVIPRCAQNEGVELGLPKTSEATLPLRLAVEGSNVGDPWYLLTNDPAFEPAA